MADVPNAGLNIVQDDLTAVTPNSNAFLDTGVLNVQSGAFLTNDVDATDADPTDGDATDYRNVTIVADAITTVASGGNTLATLQEEKLDLTDFTFNLVGTGSESSNSSPLAGTIRLANGQVVFTGPNRVDFGGHTGGTGLNGGDTNAEYDVTARIIADFDNVRFLNHTTGSNGPRMSFRGAHPTRSTFNNVSFGDDIIVLFNAGITQHGASFGGGQVTQITDGASITAIDPVAWTPWTSLDLSAVTGNIQTNGGVRWVMIAPILNNNQVSHTISTGTDVTASVEFHTPWQPNFTRADTGADILSPTIRFANSLTIRLSQTAEGYTYSGYPTATTSTGILNTVTNGQLYLIEEGAYPNTPGTRTIDYTANNRAFRHYSYEANLDDQTLNIGSYTTTARSGTEVTRFGSELNGFLDAVNREYALPIDLVADETTLATAIATTFVVDNTDKLYQAAKARYVTDQTDVDWSVVATTPLGSSIDFGDNDITWVDGTTEAIAIVEAPTTTLEATAGQTSFPLGYTPSDEIMVTVDGVDATSDFTVANPSIYSGTALEAGDVVVFTDPTNGDITVTTEEIVTGSTDAMNPNTVISNGGFTNEIITTGTVALTGVGLNGVDIDAGSITGYGDLVNSNLTSDSAIALSSGVSYGGATLTSTLTGASENFSNFPVSLSDVTLDGSADDITNIGGDAARTITNVAFNGRVQFSDTGAFIHELDGVTFSEAPRNALGGGVNIRLVGESTIASTFPYSVDESNPNGIAPTGFNVILEDLTLTINTDAVTGIDVYHRLQINGVNSGVDTNGLGVVGDTITITAADLGDNDYNISFVGAGIIEQVTPDRSYSDGNQTITIAADPLYNALATPLSTVAVNDSTTTSTFNITIPSGSSMGGGVHNRTIGGLKGSQEYADYILNAGVVSRIQFPTSTSVQYYSDSTNETGLVVSLGASTADAGLQNASVLVGAGTVDSSGTAITSGQTRTLESNQADFRSLIVTGLPGTFTPMDGTAEATTISVVAIPEEQFDYNQVGTQATNALIAYTAVTSQELIDETGSISAQLGTSTDEIKTDTETILDRTQIIIEE